MSVSSQVSGVCCVKPRAHTFRTSEQLAEVGSTQKNAFWESIILLQITWKAPSKLTVLCNDASKKHLKGKVWIPDLPRCDF